MQMRKIVIKVSNLLDKRGMTQKDLAEATGMTPTQISVICRNVGTGINKEHLAKIADVLGIKDLREIIDFE